jgi:hypothetical protein
MARSRSTSLWTIFPVLVAMPFKRSAQAHAIGMVTRDRSPAAAATAAETPAIWTTIVRVRDGIDEKRCMSETAGTAPEAGRRAPRRLIAAATRLEQGLTDAFSSTGLPVAVQGVASLFSLFFADGPILSFDDVRKAHHARYGAFFLAIARARGLPAAVELRGLVRLRGPRRGRGRPDAGGG